MIILSPFTTVVDAGLFNWHLAFLSANQLSGKWSENASSSFYCFYKPLRLRSSAVLIILSCLVYFDKDIIIGIQCLLYIGIKMVILTH